MKTAARLCREQIDRKRKEIERLEHEIETLEKQARESKTGIASWLGYPFESSSGLTEEYRSFYGDIFKFLKGQLLNDFVLDIRRKHFEFSGFVQNKVSGKWAYFSSWDVRFFPDAWYNKLLVRTAKDRKDYTGGSNQFVSLPDIHQVLLKLTVS